MREAKKKAKLCELCITNYSPLIPAVRPLSCLIYVHIYEVSIRPSRDTAGLLSKLSNDATEYKVDHWPALNNLT